MLELYRRDGSVGKADASTQKLVESVFRVMENKRRLVDVLKVGC